MCVRLHTRQLTRRLRTVSDNDKAASSKLREQLVCRQRGKHASTHWSRRPGCLLTSGYLLTECLIVLHLHNVIFIVIWQPKAGLRQIVSR